MPRTTSEQVATIVEVDSNIDLEVFILTANELVTEVCVPLGYSDARLELIERWLAAHFYKVRDQSVQSERAGPVSQSFFGQVGFILKQTKEGQQAMLLDTKGGLAQLSKDIEEGRQKSGVQWLGSETNFAEEADVE